MEKFLSHRLNPICFNIPPPVLRIFFFWRKNTTRRIPLHASFQRDIELERILWKIFEEGKKRERELLFNLCEIFLGKFFSSLLRRGNFRDEKERTQVEDSLVTKSFRGINGATFDETTKGRKVAQILRGCVETFPNESGNFFFFFFPQHSKFSTRTKSGRVNLSMMRRINNKIVKFCDRSRYHVHIQKKKKETYAIPIDSDVNKMEDLSFMYIVRQNILPLVHWKGPFMTTCYVPRQISPILSLSLFFYTYPSIYSPISKFEFSHYFPHRFSLSPDNNHHDIPSFLSLLFLHFGKKKLCHLLYHNYSTTFENRREL